MLFQLDYGVFQFINHLAISDRFLNPLMVFLAEKGEYLFFAGILFYWFYHRLENRKMVAYALLGACVALAINVLIGDFFYRDRPFVSHHVNWLISHAKNASFPSDHATAAFVIATTIWIWIKRDGWLWLTLAAAISLSRIWTGVHYPLDVIAGMVIGTGTAFAIRYVLRRFGKINKVIITVIDFYERVESRILKKSISIKKG